MRAAALALLVVGCGPALPPGAPAAPVSSVRSAPEDRDLLAMLPADAEVLLATDVAQLRASRWTRELLAAQAGPRGARGFDEVTDVDRMVLARMPGGSDGVTLTIVQGRFDRGRLAAAFRARHPSAATGSFRGCALESAGDEALAFVTARTVAAGPLAAVRGAIEAALGRAPALRDQAWLEDLEAAVAQGRGARAPAVFLAARPGDELRARLGQELERAEKVSQLAVRVDLGERLNLAAVAVARSRSDALALHGDLGQALGDLRRRPSVAALGLAPVLAALRLGTQGPRLRAELALGEEQREQITQRLALLAKVLAARASGGAPAP